MDFWRSIFITITTISTTITTTTTTTTTTIIIIIIITSLSYERSTTSYRFYRQSSGTFCFNFQYLLVSLRSSSSCLPLLPRLHVISISYAIFPSLMCFGKQFLRKMWPLYLAFLWFIVSKMFLSCSALCKYYFMFHRPGQVVGLHLSPIPNVKTFQVFLIYFPKWSRCNTTLKTVLNENMK